MTAIASPQRAVPFDNPFVPSPLKGGANEDALLFRCVGSIVRRYRMIEDATASASNRQRAAVENRELAKEDTEVARLNLIHRQASFEGCDIAPDSREAVELRALNDAYERAKVREAKAAEELDRIHAEFSHDDQTFRKLRRFVNGKVNEQNLIPVPVTPDPGVDVLVAVAAKGSSLNGVQLQRVTVNNGYGPAAALEQQLLRDLDTLAAQGEISIAGLDGETRRPRIVWPTRPLDAAPARGGSGDRPRVLDSEAMFARLFRDRIAEEIRAAVAATYADLDPAEILDPADKRARLASLDREIDRLQRELAELIWLAREAGYDVPFPIDLPAAAILGVAA